MSYPDSSKQFYSSMLITRQRCEIFPTISQLYIKPENQTNCVSKRRAFKSLLSNKLQCSLLFWSSKLQYERRGVFTSINSGYLIQLLWVPNQLQRIIILKLHPFLHNFVIWSCDNGCLDFSLLCNLSQNFPKANW